MKNKLLLIFITLLFFFGCRQQHPPKPRGFFRIDFPEKQYHSLKDGFPYQFEIPVYSKISPDKRNPGKSYWFNLQIPDNKAEIHISYYNLTNGDSPPRRLLFELTEETRRLAYKHSVKANAIEEQIFMNPGKDVSGTIYRIKGNAASPFQFFLTDSTSHFLRGALYIKATPDIDSLKPIINYLEKDVIRIIETTRWN